MKCYNVNCGNNDNLRCTYSDHQLAITEDGKCDGLWYPEEIEE